jgi:hypothetical protein
MKKKILTGAVLVIVAVIIGLIVYLKVYLPHVGDPENLTVNASPEKIEHGKYLANSVYVCMDCHSIRDWNKFSGPLLEETYGQGGEEFNQQAGLPGRYFSRNITPFALKDWTDGEILRAISCGVNKEGKALFPIMPYLNYGKLDKEELLTIIAFLRTLNPIANVVPESESDFPVNFLINTMPQKAAFTKIPNPENKVEYGAYLVSAASCNDCHTKIDNGKPVKGMDFAGGFEFPMPTGGIVRSGNITPDKTTGIGNWTEVAFYNRFKAYGDTAFRPATVNKGEFNTFMPWMMYGKMNAEELNAIYAYLMTLKPVRNTVLKFTSTASLK